MHPALCLLGFSVDEDDADFNLKVHFPVWSISCLPCHWRGPAMFSDPYKDHTSSSLAATAVPMVSTMLVSALLPAVVSGVRRGRVNKRLWTSTSSLSTRRKSSELVMPPLGREDWVAICQALYQGIDAVRCTKNKHECEESEAKGCLFGKVGTWTFFCEKEEQMLVCARRLGFRERLLHVWGVDVSQA